MTKKMIAVRGVDEDAFRKFKAVAAEENINVGNALTVAMKQWTEKEKIKTIPNPKNLLKIKGIIKPFSWGKDTENTSKDVDEILYGSKK
ncbi:MAG: hypothetical protein HY516_03965 [Candidatus Aenigmarchaeota archaeon]|nr:hypothetical protein [Candidatus Aenigmarchaeota archaeon]